MSTTRLPLFAALAAGVLSLIGGGCAPAIIAGGTTGAVVANDERSAGSFIEDQEIELKAAFQILEQIGRQANINVTSYNRRVLLSGQAPTEDLRQQALAIVNKIENVRKVFDELEIGGPSSLTSRTADTALTAKVKTALCRLQIAGFSCLDVKVVSEKGVVYLMGLVSKQQAATAVDTTRNTGGVIRVVKVFEYLQ